MAAKFQQNAGTWLPFNLVFFKKRQIKWQPSSSILLVLGCHLIWCFLKKTQIYFFHRKIKSAIFLFLKKKAKYGSQIPAYGFFEFPVAGERLRERRHRLPRPHAPAPQAAETLMRNAVHRRTKLWPCQGRSRRACSSGAIPIVTSKSPLGPALFFCPVSW